MLSLSFPVVVHFTVAFVRYCDVVGSRFPQNIRDHVQYQTTQKHFSEGFEVFVAQIFEPEVSWDV